MSISLQPPLSPTPNAIMAVEFILTCEQSAFESAPVFLIDGLVYTFTVSILVGQVFEEHYQTTLLAKGKWVRSHMIVWTHYPSFKPQFIAR